jgi:hypothetical protein
MVKVTRFCLSLIFISFILPVKIIHAWSYEEIDGVRIIQNQVFEGETLDISGSVWDGAIIRENIFKNTDEQQIALYIKDTRNVLIEKNEFFEMKYFAILLTSLSVQTWGTDNITIKDNYFHDTLYTCIHAVEPNKNVKIIDNVFENIAMSPSTAIHAHAIYLRGPDFLIEGNTINKVGNSEGISVRSSGVVRGNWIENANRYGIEYFSDSEINGNGVLIIENNVVTNCRNAGIIFDSGKHIGIDQAIVRFNTLVNNNRGYSYEIWIYELEEVDFQIYGNIIVDSKENYFSYYPAKPKVLMANLTSPSDIGFVDFNGKDYRLKDTSDAIDFVTGIPALPPYDFSGNAMGKEPFDAGAY